MIQFFRKIRQNLLSKNKFSDYLVYAVGEIALVVIGILIALSINNWNENKKSENQLLNIYNEVQLNLEADLSSIENIIKQYERLDLRLANIVDEQYSNFLLDSINADNYSNCIPCLGDINSYIPFEIQDKGFELLKTHNDFNTTRNRSITNEIIQFYNNYKPLNVVLGKLEEESFNNLKFFEQFSWYPDFMNGKFNPDMIEFFAKNEKFKNKVITYRLVAVQNYLPILRSYRESATLLLHDISTLHE